MPSTMSFSEYVSRFKQVRPSMPNEITSALDETAPWLKAIVSAATQVAPPASRNGSYGAVATGKMLNSWKATRIGTKGILISNGQVQAVIADYGRAPGKKMPPVSKIMQWAQVRLGLGYAEAKRAAWPIARAIAQRGLQKRGILHSDQRNAQLARIMETRFTKTVALTFRKAFGV